MPDRDDLLARAERLARQQKARTDANEEAEQPFVLRIWRRMHDRFTIIRHAVETLDVIWNYWLKPISIILNPLFRLYIRACKWLFVKFSYYNGEYDKYRGAAMTMVILVFSAFAGYKVITRIVPFTLDLTYDAIAINLFSHSETLVFSQPQNVEGEPGILKVYACRAFPCEGQSDSIEYRMRDSAYLDVVRLFTKFEPHDPGELAGAFVSEENGCKISAFGIRNKWLGWYPYITEATCRSINGANHEQVLQEMRRH